MEISPDDIYRCRENLVTREIVGETIIVPISGQLSDLQQVYSLNATGGFVWSRLDGSTSLEIIHKAVIASFKVRKKDAWTDLSELVSDRMQAPYPRRSMICRATTDLPQVCGASSSTGSA